MISDVLSDALSQIEQCQRDNPETYADPHIQYLIALVKDSMQCLLLYLDTPPAPPNIPDELGE